MLGYAKRHWERWDGRQEEDSWCALYGALGGLPRKRDGAGDC